MRITLRTRLGTLVAVRGDTDVAMRVQGVPRWAVRRGDGLGVWRPATAEEQRWLDAMESAMHARREPGGDGR